MDPNVTPRSSRRRGDNLFQVTPDKHEALRKYSLEYTKTDGPRLRTNIMTWETSDASPMPDEGILRDFDLETKYGPCCTLSREERWIRAHELGLNPPRYILDVIHKINQNTSVLDVHMKQVS